MSAFVIQLLVPTRPGVEEWRDSSYGEYVTLSEAKKDFGPSSVDQRIVHRFDGKDTVVDIWEDLKDPR